jgi:inhibitor of cysteine peptidase
MKRLKLLPFSLCVFLITGLLTGCSTAKANGGSGDTSPGSTASVNLSAQDTGSRKLTHAASYSDVYKALSAAAARANTANFYGAAADSAAGNKVTASAAAAPGAETGSAAVGSSAAAPDENNGVTAQSPDYSQTNVQVNGVDEGDIVKTDGQYIYVLRQNELIIFKADGISTKRISSVKIGTDSTVNQPAPGYGVKAPDRIGYGSEYATDIYITGNTAVIVSSYSNYGPYIADSTVKSGSTSGAESGSSSDSVIPPAESNTIAIKPSIAPINNKQITKLYIFDIADRSNPVQKAELGQDGYLLTTRLIGSTLFMLSNYTSYSAVESDSSSYIPNLYTAGTAKLVNPDSISIMPYSNSTGYTVICAYDLPSAALSLSQSILGGGSTVYMNEKTLYLANSTSSQTVSAPYTDSVYTVLDYSINNVTDITSFDISGGQLALKASGTVPGSLNSQFALDEYNGSLRVVTTTNSQSWSEYTDKAKGFVNYKYKDPTSANALYVLDGSLKTIGGVENLAKGEQVYSVRFDGAIGYFVTFRQVDPLFAVDLTDPAKPVVLSSLKIPGFSEYLHVYSSGRLFGLGMSADANGRTDGMKLTMFDTTNPADVSVKNFLKLDSSYSSALNNHKAILISADKNIIAFPADNGYGIYSYSDAQGFIKKASISSIEWNGDSRGLYIGDLAYIVDTQSISVLDMAGFTLLGRISY